MTRQDVLRAYVEGQDHLDDPTLAIQDDVLYVDGWWPAAIRLQPSTHILRVDADSPEPDLATELRAALGQAGYHSIEREWPVVEAITLQRLGLMGAAWEVWAASEDDAEAAVAGGALGDNAPATIREAGDVARLVEIHEQGAARPRYFSGRGETEEPGP